MQVGRIFFRKSTQTINNPKSHKKSLFNQKRYNGTWYVFSLFKPSLKIANLLMDTLLISVAIQFELLPPPSDAVTSLKFAPGNSTRLLVSSWDKHVYLYDTQDQEAGGKLIQKYEHRAPVLDICFGADDNEAFSAGMDWQVKK